MNSFYIPNRLTEMRHIGSCQLRALGDQVASMCLHPMARGKRLMRQRRREKLPVVAAEEFSLHVCMLNHVQLCDSMDWSPWGSSVCGIPGKNTRVGCHSLLQGTFPTQRSNPHLLCPLHWQVDSLPLRHPKPQRIQRWWQKIRPRGYVCFMWKDKEKIWNKTEEQQKVVKDNKKWGTQEIS